MKYIYLILLLPFIAYSQGADTCSISGTLYDVYGRVLANAEVKIKEVRKSGYVISATEVTKNASPQGVVQFPLPRTTGTDTVKARIYINAYPWNRNSSTGVWVAIPNAATATLASLTTTTYIPPTVAVTVTGLYSSGTLGQVWKTLAGGVQGWAADSAGGGAGRTYLNAGLNILVDSTGALYTVRHKIDSLHVTKAQRDKIEGAANGDSVSTALATKRNIADTTKPAGTVTWTQVRVEVKDSLNNVVRSESDPLAVKIADSASYSLGYVTKKSQTDTLNANVVRTESDPVYAAAASGLRLKSDTTKPAGTVTWTQARIEVGDSLDKAFTDTTGRNLAVQNISAGGGTNAQVLTNIGGAHVAWRDAAGGSADTNRYIPIANSPKFTTGRISIGTLKSLSNVNVAGLNADTVTTTDLTATVGRVDSLIIPQMVRDTIDNRHYDSASIRIVETCYPFRAKPAGVNKQGYVKFEVARFGVGEANDEFYTLYSDSSNSVSLLMIDIETTFYGSELAGYSYRFGGKHYALIYSNYTTDGGWQAGNSDGLGYNSYSWRVSVQKVSSTWNYIRPRVYSAYGSGYNYVQTWQVWFTMPQTATSSWFVNLKD